MDQVLSTGEVDALMEAAVKSVDEEPQDGPQEFDVETVPILIEKIDLTKQGRIRRGAMPVLDIIQEKFGRQLRSDLSVELRRMVDVEPGVSRLIRLGDFISSLPSPRCLCSFSLESLKGNGVFVVDAKLAYALVEIFCGGSAYEQFEMEDREFTPIELKLVKRIVIMAMELLGKSWKQVHAVEFKFERIETNPQFIALGHHSEVMIVAPLNIDIEGNKGGMSVVIPYSILTPLKQKLEGGLLVEQKEVQAHWSHNIEESIKEVAVGLRVLFGKGTVTVDELINLEEGEVITLENRPGDPVEIAVGGRQKLLGFTGLFRGNRAVQLYRTMDK